MSIRDNAQVTVTSTISGRKKVATRKRPARWSRVHNRKIHADVLARAMQLADGDISRIWWISETEVDVINASRRD